MPLSDEEKRKQKKDQIKKIPPEFRDWVLKDDKILNSLVYTTAEEVSERFHYTCTLSDHKLKSVIQRYREQEETYSKLVTMLKGRYAYLRGSSGATIKRGNNEDKKVFKRELRPEDFMNNIYILDGFDHVNNHIGYYMSISKLGKKYIHRLYCRSGHPDMSKITFVPQLHRAIREDPSIRLCGVCEPLNVRFKTTKEYTKRMYERMKERNWESNAEEMRNRFGATDPQLRKLGDIYLFSLKEFQTYMKEMVGRPALPLPEPDPDPDLKELDKQDSVPLFSDEQIEVSSVPQMNGPYGPQEHTINQSNNPDAYYLEFFEGLYSQQTNEHNYVSYQWL